MSLSCCLWQIKQYSLKVFQIYPGYVNKTYKQMELDLNSISPLNTAIQALGHMK